MNKISFATCDLFILKRKSYTRAAKKIAMKKHFIYLFLSLSLLFSCKKNKVETITNCRTTSEVNDPVFLLQGKIKVQGFTYHQYGTHYIIADSTYYALKSDLYNLDSFVNIDTTIIGKKIPGYPLNFGIDPEYLEVIDFK